MLPLHKKTHLEPYLYNCDGNFLYTLCVTHTRLGSSVFNINFLEKQSASKHMMLCEHVVIRISLLLFSSFYFCLVLLFGLMLLVTLCHCAHRPCVCVCAILSLYFLFPDFHLLFPRKFYCLWHT